MKNESSSFNEQGKIDSSFPSVAHYDMRFLKPIDEDILHEVGKKFKRVITIEDGVVSGGLGSAVLEFFADHGYQVEVERMGIPDAFVEHGTVAQLRAICKMDAEAIKERVCSK
jgi:1-deoxy-D-xylulose-5-phosphate synthase